jgi:hypothetical protein
MRRRTKAEWQQLFTEFDGSGEKAEDFCATRGLSAAYFVKRRRQLEKPSAGFVPVRMGSGAGRVLIQVADISIRCEANVPVIWLHELISTLRR